MPATADWGWLLASSASRRQNTDIYVRDAPLASQSRRLPIIASWYTFDTPATVRGISFIAIDSQTATSRWIMNNTPLRHYHCINRQETGHLSMNDNRDRPEQDNRVRAHETFHALLIEKCRTILQRNDNNGTSTTEYNGTMKCSESCVRHGSEPT